MRTTGRINLVWTLGSSGMVSRLTVTDPLRPAKSYVACVYDSPLALGCIAAPESRRSRPEARRALFDRPHRAAMDRTAHRLDERALMPGLR